jgi:hypothetical protein
VQVAVEAELQEVDRSKSPKIRNRRGKAEEEPASNQQEITLVLMDSVAKLLKQFSTEPHVVSITINFQTACSYLLVLSTESAATLCLELSFVPIDFRLPTYKAIIELQMETNRGLA